MLPEYEAYIEMSESLEHGRTKDIKPLLPEFETQKETFERQSKMVLALGEKDAAATWAQRLRWCRGGQCILSMCPSCLREQRICFILGALSSTDKIRSVLNQAPELPITAFSGVLNNGRYPVGQLDHMDLPFLKRRVQRELQRAGFPLAFAGINISFIEENPPQNPPFWQAQVDGVVVGFEVDAVKSALQSRYLSTASNPRALERAKLPQALSDVIQPTFVRQVTYINNAGHQTTENYDLDASQLQELALALSEFELPDRFALTGCRRCSANAHDLDAWPGWMFPDLGVLGRIEWANRRKTAQVN
jgi:hypothetical protein